MQTAEARIELSSGSAPLLKILDQARWAPSGDNEQPWRFEIVGDLQVNVHGHDTRHRCVYDLDGHASQLAIGALLETASIAASAHGLRLEAERRLDAPEERPIVSLRFVRDPRIVRDPLCDSIERRTVQRRPMSKRLLTSEEKSTLEGALGDGFRVHWLEGAAAKRRTAGLLFSNAQLRLTLPEAYRTHRDAIEWNARFSESRVPEQALGVDPMTAKLMRWAMTSWERVHFLNRFAAGTWIPRLQMDLLPAWACGAHFLLTGQAPPETIDDHLSAGRAVQRFWLTATQLALDVQPEMTPVIFARYARQERAFSADPRFLDLGRRLGARFAALVGEERAPRGVFFGRIGAGPSATARSTRRPLDELSFRS